MEKIKARLTISRSSHDAEQGALYIKVRDVASSHDFIKLELTNDDLVNALFGRAEVEIMAKIDQLDLVGKTREIKPFSIRVPCRPYDERKQYESDLLSQCPEGWQVRLSLSSQNSIKNESDGMVTLNTYIYRYV